MSTHIAIYRPDDLPTAAFDYTVSFQPLIEILRQAGIEPILPQRRLHPSWRDHDQNANSLAFDVVEIPANQYIEYQHSLKLMGFEAWPESQDTISSLYQTEPDD